MTSSSASYIARIALASGLAIIASACAGSLTEPRQPEPGHPGPPPVQQHPSWRDLGAIPNATTGSTIAMAGDTVLVGTSNGVWRRALDGSGAWEASGLDGLDVRVLRIAPGNASLVFAGVDPGTMAGALPFYVSADGGRSWTGSGNGLFAAFEQQYIPMADLAVQPASSSSMPPTLYAAMSGPSMARSSDLGKTWQFVQGVADFFAGDNCELHISPALPDTLYEGCESPLDEAWVDAYDIHPRDAASGDSASDSALARRMRVVTSDIATGIGNRRPNGFASTPADPGTVYVGLEGALIAIHGASWQWLWRGSTSADSARAGEYTFVRTIWIDPHDPRHIIFGGGTSGDDSLRRGLHETMDRGATLTVPVGPPGVDFTAAAIPAGVAAGPDGETLVLLVAGGDSVRVVVREE